MSEDVFAVAEAPMLSSPHGWPVAGLPGDFLVGCGLGYGDGYGFGFVAGPLTDVRGSVWV